MMPTDLKNLCIAQLFVIAGLVCYAVKQLFCSELLRIQLEEKEENRDEC